MGDCMNHLLHLLKAFFERRCFEGKSLFRVLSKCCEQEDIRMKIFELVFLVCFFCKDLPTDKLDAYCEESRVLSLNVFNSACNSLHYHCNPMLTKCIFQIVGDTLKQFTLTQEELEQTVHFIGSEEIFMRKLHRINIDDLSIE